MKTSKWEIRPGSKGADWEYYHPVHTDGTPHRYKGFIRLILKSSGAYLLEARRARGDKWVRFEEGHRTCFEMMDGQFVSTSYPTPCYAENRAYALHLLPNS